MTRQPIRFVFSFLLIALVATSLSLPARAPAHAQDCGDAPPPRLAPGGLGRVLITDGQPLNVRDLGTLSGARVGQMPEGSVFTVLSGPLCSDSIYWWEIRTDIVYGYIAEGTGSDSYFVEPFSAPGGAPVSYFTYDWNAFLAMTGRESADPMTIIPPPVYAGNLPALPVDLGGVRFVDDPGLNEAQKALLAQNGFVVVPAGFAQFSDAYRGGEDWPEVPPTFDYEADPSTWDLGHAYFITTDATLHALHYIFDNLLTDLEQQAFYYLMYSEILLPSLQAAHQQSQDLAGTPLAGAAANAELYLAVAYELFAPGEMAAFVSPDIAEQAGSLAALALAGEGQAPIPFLPGYIEDFSQYRPRGHYAGDPILESYFRGMMWSSRITFLAEEDASTQMALLLLRALLASPGAYDAWKTLHETLTFLIGPIDDLGPLEYEPLALEIFGSELAPEKLADPALLASFKARVAELPGPRVNGVILPPDTTAGEVVQKTRGFRFLGQRFTFDAYAMQQVMYPYVGTRENQRALPLGLDVPAVLGSETAYTLAGEAGATAYAHYDTQIARLRGEIGVLTDAQWLENVYGGWLWALKPLFARDAAAYPPLMQTGAWLRKDLQSGLASWTELKHDTVLYAKQPTGFGGGGPPLTSFGYVEPNPLVFARIAVVAAMTYQGIQGRNLPGPPQLHGYTPEAPGKEQWLARQSSSLDTSLQELVTLAYESAALADMARRELAGEPLIEDDYWTIMYFGTYLDILLRTLYQGEGEPDPVALVTDVASNPGNFTVLQEGVGGVDMIYVVVPAPRGGFQMVRGGVFSYYEFVGDINQRMTDDEWRARVASGDLPPRPAWVNAFYSE